jgi:5-deoxy-5-amino-3-dehydroquinate synthase
VIRVPVDLGDRSYEVLVGDGAFGHIDELLPPSAKRAAIVTQMNIPTDIRVGIDHAVFVIGDGERAKSLETVELVCRSFASWGLTRDDVVIAIGGGVVTDVGGFAAAVYHRGVPVVNVATTLLAQVDAAIGGKTGVNLPEGKNLIGAFWQPSGVICDTAMLATLPAREYRSGTGEMAKYHFLGGEGLEDLPLDARVARCVEIKAAVVASDERESGRRATLNYGHTLAHALETAGSFDLRHGEAVAIGLVFAAQLARAVGRVGDARVDDHRRVVASYDLPMALPSASDAQELVALMRRDKKATAGLTFVLDGPRGVEVVPDVDEAVVIDQLRQMGAR